MASRKILHGVSGQACAPDPWCDECPESVLSGMRGVPKPILLGLPCARCRAYYDADLTACPICGRGERVPPNEVTVLVRPQSRAA